MIKHVKVYGVIRALVVLGSLVLSACVRAPLSENAYLELYAWDQRESAITVRTAMADGGSNAAVNFNLTDLVLNGDVSSPDAETPMLLRSCDDGRCFSAVVFPGDFALNEQGLLLGAVVLSGLSTAMANDVSETPATEVRERLNLMSTRVARLNNSEINYARFIGLDILDNGLHRSALLDTTLEDEARDIIGRGDQPSFNQILNGNATQTDELFTDSEFRFDTSFELQIDIDVAGRVEGDVYFMVCGDFTVDGGAYVINYDNCQLKTRLAAGQYQGELTLSGGQVELLAVLLPLNNPQAAEYHPWRSGEEPVISVR